MQVLKHWIVSVLKQAAAIYRYMVIWLLCLVTLTYSYSICADPERFVKEGQTLTPFFLLVIFFYLKRGSKYQYKQAIIGPQQNAVFRWSAPDSPTLNTGLVGLWFFRRFAPVLLRNPVFFSISQGMLRIPSPPSGSAICEISNLLFSYLSY